MILNTSVMVHDALLKHLKHTERTKKRKRCIVPRHVHAVQSQGQVLAGDEAVERIYDLLENAFKDREGHSLIRSTPQITIHENYIRACLPKIYQDEW